MFTDNSKIYIKKDKIYDFIQNHQLLGFIADHDGSYFLKKILSDTHEELYVIFTVSPTSRHVYIEFHVPCSFWIEVGLGTFEPLFSMYEQGYLEFKIS